MANEVFSESLLTLSEAATLLPGRPSLSGINRWRLRGVGGVRLKTWKIGGRRYTSFESIGRFVDELTAKSEGKQAQVRTHQARQRAIEQAERELAADPGKPGGRPRCRKAPVA